MHHAIAERASFAKELLLPAWRWLVAAPFAIVSVAQTVRDELLATEIAEKYKLNKLFQYIPDIDWRWYVVMTLVIIIIILFEGAFRAMRRRQEQLFQVVSLLNDQDQQMYGVLSVVVRIEYHRHDESSQWCDLELIFELTTSYPVAYGFAHAEVSFDGRQAPDLPANVSRLGTVVPGEQRNFVWARVTNVRWNDDKNWRGSAKYQIWFGPIGGAFRYYIDRDATLETFGDKLTEHLDRDDRGLLNATGQAQG
jgi:hypothetical protein